MQIVINNTEYKVPSDIDEISLGTYIQWNSEFGNDLQSELSKIIEANYEDETLKTLLIDDHLDKEALAWFSFHTKLDFSIIENTPDVLPLLEIYKGLKGLLYMSELDALTPKASFNWNDGEWVIQDYKVDAKSSMTFNEIITSKELMRQIHKVGLSKWDAMPYLCAIFLRRPYEAFDESFVHENSERIELMKQLPLTIAFNVAFFLTNCVNSLAKISPYSQQEEGLMKSPN